MLPARFAPVLTGLILSGFMSLAVSAVATLRVAAPRALPLAEALARFVPQWLGAWLPA